MKKFKKLENLDVIRNDKVKNIEASVTWSIVTHVKVVRKKYQNIHFRTKCKRFCDDVELVKHFGQFTL